MSLSSYWLLLCFLQLWGFRHQNTNFFHSFLQYGLKWEKAYLYTRLVLKVRKSYFFKHMFPLLLPSSNFSNSIKLSRLDLAVETLSFQLIKCMKAPAMLTSLKITCPLLGAKFIYFAVKRLDALSWNHSFQDSRACWLHCFLTDTAVSKQDYQWCHSVIVWNLETRWWKFMEMKSSGVFPCISY